MALSESQSEPIKLDLPFTQLWCLLAFWVWDHKFIDHIYLNKNNIVGAGEMT